MNHEAPTVPPPSRIVRPRDLSRVDGLSKTRRYALIAAGQYPQPVQLHGRAVGFYEHEVMAWIASRPRVGRTTRNTNAPAVAAEASISA